MIGWHINVTVNVKNVNVIVPDRNRAGWIIELYMYMIIRQIRAIILPGHGLCGSCTAPLRGLTGRCNLLNNFCDC